MEIGQMINQRRTELGLTLEQVGDAVGVSKGTVKKWENGFISNMRRDKISELAKVLKINPVSIITGELVLLSQSYKKEFSISDHEKEVIIAYRKHPEMQNAVDTLLGVPSEEQKEKYS